LWPASDAPHYVAGDSKYVPNPGLC